MNKLILNVAPALKFICWFQIIIAAYFIVSRQDYDFTFLTTFLFFGGFLFYIKFLRLKNGNN
jgi:hypothetical protein